MESADTIGATASKKKRFSPNNCDNQFSRLFDVTGPVAIIQILFLSERSMQLIFHWVINII